MVIKAGETAAETVLLKAKAHELGAARKEVVAIRAEYEEGLRATFTGIYLGPSLDGTTGLVLSVAHVFMVNPQSGPAKAPRDLTLAFGPRMEAPGALRIPVRRVRLHPDFAYVKAAQGAAQGQFLNDLAILEFELAPHLAQLAQLGVTPAVLYEGKGYGKPHLDGMIAGYGRFGTHTSEKYGDHGTVHAGHTKVSYGDWHGLRQGFLHCGPMPKSGEDLRASKDPDANCSQFLPMDTPLPLLDPLDQSTRVALSHPNQAMPSAGDCGGPLFFKTKGDVLKVAGVFCLNYVIDLKIDAKRCTPCHVPFWEAVFNHLPWLQSVQRGTPAGGTTLVLAPSTRVEPDGGESKASTPAVASQPAVPLT